MRKLWVSVLCFLILYVIGFGPVLWCAVKVDRVLSGHDALKENVGKVMIVVVYPHIMAMAISETYYNYGAWWMMISGEIVYKDYPGFRRKFMPK